MSRVVCSVCGYMYDVVVGNQEMGVARGTLWELLSEEWMCPLCGMTKSAFHKALESASRDTQSEAEQYPPTDYAAIPLSNLEKSAICSNLSRGCEKQYLHQAAQWFGELAAYYRSIATPSADPSFAALQAVTQSDLQNALPQAVETATAHGDRGALRALTWVDKVTRIHKSLLTRYAKDGEAMMEGLDAYVCSACGFIYLGTAPPSLCPVCKVPSWKFEQAAARRA